ncbi:tetratricopeptide (TPR) repeat protein [Rhizomicrobium palustre]|uniref:Tetratricopeptide (TPR) repeat protein n=1 Tax=Rhizomicrobium palustre TaxID=189966 RepID=A0A846MZ15_9PROT|nr:tetratricopeptide repeat protein [Rhizomicrobium palustre]NIK88489.1 tetratricopeptide (TPR) repeat protein [Rhizomicrobium palustre]
MRISIKILGLAAVLAAAPVTGWHSAYAGSAAADDAEIAALDLEAAGKFDDAVLKHREALQLAPKNKSFKENAARTLNSAAVAKHEAKNDAAAVAYLEEALTLMPNFQAAKDNLMAIKGQKTNADGIAALKAGDYAGAVAKFEEVLKVQPDNKSARINLDVAQAQLLMKDDPAGAVEKLKDAVSLDPDRQFLKDKLADAQKAVEAKAAAEAEAAKKAKK